jgi:hypothetical protein
MILLACGGCRGKGDFARGREKGVLKSQQGPTTFCEVESPHLDNDSTVSVSKLDGLERMWMLEAVVQQNNSLRYRGDVANSTSRHNRCAASAWSMRNLGIPQVDRQGEEPRASESCHITPCAVLRALEVKQGRKETEMSQ